KQIGYLDWKCAVLGNIGQSRSIRPNGAVHVDLTPLAELGELRQVIYWGDGKKHITEDFLKALTPLALAVWYMDDGAFTIRSKGIQARTVGGSGRIEVCVEAMSPGSRVRLAHYLRDVHGIDCRVRLSGAGRKAVLVMSRAGTDRFQEII